jgi:hypothetical protein
MAAFRGLRASVLLLLGARLVPRTARYRDCSGVFWIARFPEVSTNVLDEPERPRRVIVAAVKSGSNTHETGNRLRMKRESSIMPDGLETRPNCFALSLTTNGLEIQNNLGIPSPTVSRPRSGCCSGSTTLRLA